MFGVDIENIISNMLLEFGGNLEYYLPKIIAAIVILILGVLFAIWVYKIVIYFFKRFKILELIESIGTSKQQDHNKKKDTKKELHLGKNWGEKIQIDIVVAKAAAYYVFLLFFRFAIVAIGIDDIESFLSDLLAYLPNLFIAFVIGFFGLRFANFIYDISYHSLKLTKHNTAKIIASGCKIIILFFTLMAVLTKAGIATEIIHTILIGFISMLALAGGLAFGLGGKEIAREILESFRK